MTEILRVERQQLSKSISDILIEQVREGTLGPGDRLPSLREMAEMFEVSIPAVREALKILEARNIVQSIQGKGVFVCEQPGLIKEPFGFDLVSHPEPLLLCLEARMGFEPTAAYFAAKRANDEDIEAISTAVADMRRLLAEHRPHMEAELRFHRCIARASHNPFIVRIQAAVSSHYQSLPRRRGLSKKVPAQLDKALRFHEGIRDAILNRDPEEAKRLMKAHLLDTYADYRRVVDEQPSDND